MVKNNIIRGCKRRIFKLKGPQISFMSNNKNTHYGIKTIGADDYNSCSFSGKSDLCIRIVTWNMNGKVSYEDMVELIGKERRFDLLVIGLQEVPKGNVSQLLQTASSETHVLLGKAKMQSIQLYLFGPKNSETLLKELRVERHSVGGCGCLIRRKKGAVALRINYKGIKMVFISCHLSAHAKKVEERNSECRHISHSLLSSSDTYRGSRHLTVWLGDLNYRIQDDISNRPVRSLIRRHLHSFLVGKDQLLQEAERGQIFKGYCEGTLSFKPTYKYNIGSSSYDTSHKVRVPAWTDRILFKIEDPGKIRASLHCYDSIDEICGSDHKPVKAHLCLKLVHQ
ncbi:PREDICTED: type IV inositol polyphosphate 5-phosphatase 11 [Tarenaya hassleriana]|uniref:type IV inositol polyphosphate 5-phosphatase 11 n=1 Tax=Tarenaya hassleriana TaxID=28532 RepID=UPI00053C2D69|nr:PREDICTED: type IV inositol polyphosphate 5-phosphatase 11 [Tarenaya hassleriana]XP_010539061.1 PREDICTED: type IV inositol polyphosphate 5-phosphatase 11 [Tarenaya hassleriana]